MGKKKDKAAKSKKKSKTDIVVEPESEIIEDIAAESDTIQDLEAKAESIQYAEHVTAEDVMELINTLSQDLNKLDESNQLLQQQVAQSQKAPQRQHTALKIIAIMLSIGIIAVGYGSAKINSRMDENMGVTSTDLDKTTSRITTLNTSIESMTSDINKINASLDKLSADVTTINQNVNKLASDVNRINTSTASTTQPNTRYMGRPTDPWPRW